METEDEQIKEAFQKVKDDMLFLKTEIDSLKKQLEETRIYTSDLCEIIKDLSKKTEKNPENQEKPSEKDSTNQHKISTIPTEITTHNYSLEPLKPKNIHISIGNEGVSTDRQTDKQTNRHKENLDENSSEAPENSIEKATEILDSLDDIKKDLRIKFKRLTEQEMLVFSTIYQLEEDQGYSDYKALAEKLNLSESSVRDYVGRIIKKGIPVDKKKINNKNIQLTISSNLKKITTLATIMQLRGI